MNRFRGTPPSGAKRRTMSRLLAVIALAGTVAALGAAAASPVTAEPIRGGTTLRINVPEAVGAKTVIGQLTVDRVTERGYVTAWDCSAPRPNKSDLNYNGFIVPVASNRLIVAAADNGDICFYTSATAELVIDISAVTTAFENVTVARTDTRTTTGLAAGEVLEMRVPAAAGGKTVHGQLTVDNVTSRGYVTAWDCSEPMPIKSDLNFDGTVKPVASNRLVVTASELGDVCFYTMSEADLIIDVNGVTDDIDVFANQRTDTRETGTRIERGAVARINVPQAAGAKTVFGQLTVDQVFGYSGYVTAWDCSEPRPLKSDLNFSGFWSQVASNRLVLTANDAGDMCFYFSEAGALIVDVSGVSDDIDAIPNQRFDTRTADDGFVGIGTLPPDSHICAPGETDIAGVIYGWSGYDEVGNPTYWRIPYCAD